MYGAEFLLYPKWRAVAQRLSAQGVKLSVSTNGLLLTPANVQHLIDSDSVSKLNVSFDGATAATLEAIRVNVKFDQLCRNVEHLLAYVDERGSRVQVSFSFVLMKSNFREFPRLVELIDRLRQGHRVALSVYGQGLEYYDAPSYSRFLQSEHHSLVDRAELLATFEEALRVSHATGITVGAFHAGRLEEFMAAGAPFPPLERPGCAL
jgi:MoaA/NifB/PqqE/SkfB family radical SAM enzyme